MVCYLYPRHDRLEAIKSLGIYSVCLNLKSGFFQWPHAVIRIKRIIREQGIHLIHTSNYEADMIGGLAARYSGIPAVSTLTNISREPERLIDNAVINRSKMILAESIHGLILRRCYVSYVAISETVKESAIRSFGLGADKFRVIYRALSSNWFHTQGNRNLAHSKDELGVSGSYPIILNVGRLVPQKGQRYLIEAISKCSMEFPNIRLLIVGQGFLLQSLLELRDSLDLQHNVSFLGSRNDVRDLLELSDLFVFPSIYEGFGNAWLEAAASGKPCILSDIGALREGLTADYSGIFVPSRDSKTLARAILDLAHSPEQAKQLGSNAAREVKERFRVSATITQLEALYEDVIRPASKQ